MAVATGRDVLAVARDSYALTLYTHWHLEQRRRLDLIARKSERFDLAGLMAAAYHEPKVLGERFEAFLASLRTPTSARASDGTPPDGGFARQVAVIRAAHAPHGTQTLIPS